VTQAGTHFGPGSHLDLIERLSRTALEAGVIMQTTDTGYYRGQHVEIGGKRLLNFGGCSYLGLDQRQELRDAAIDAIHRYGTQFSISRFYLESPLYRELEASLGTMTGGHVLVAPTTTLAHLAALPVLCQPGDAVLIDHFAHASLHMAVGLIRQAHVEVVRHNRIELLEEKIARLAKTHARVWFLFDGLYSMLGDFAPMDLIASLLEKYPQLHLYIDDAHSTSCFGDCGRGHALQHLTDRSRAVVALSLNKAFSAAGGALVFASSELRDRVRCCGGPLLFSGPIQPPMLGAAVASASLHLQPNFTELQHALYDRIRQVSSAARELGIRFISDSPSPIFFVRCSPTSLAIQVARTLLDKGFYVCVSSFPAVPERRAGIRFTVSLHNTDTDILQFMDALAHTMRPVLPLVKVTKRPRERSARPIA
jgi:7-keto-8-aminopelargonate synthetase-like enzyme